MALLRALLFYLGYAASTVIWGAISVLCAWLLPYRARFAFVVGIWTRFNLWWLRITCRVTWQIEGLDNLPDTPCIVMVRHESTWETLFLQTLFAPQATLIKRELLWIPFFGWAFRLLRPIAINRNHPRRSLRRLVEEGARRLAAGTWIVLFPEGTRMPPGHTGRFQAGGGALAAATGAPIVVVAHNAGDHWPAHALAKHAGTIRVLIAPPIQVAGQSSKAVSAEAQRAMARLMARLRPMTRAGDEAQSPSLDAMELPSGSPDIA